MFRRMALFLVVAGLVTALLPRQSRGYQMGTCTYIADTPPTEPANTWLSENQITIGGFTTLWFSFNDVDRCRYPDGSFGLPGIDAIGVFRVSVSPPILGTPTYDLGDTIATATFEGKESGTTTISSSADDAGNFADDPGDPFDGTDQSVTVVE
jgi:hypothetical protein